MRQRGRRGSSWYALLPALLLAGSAAAPAAPSRSPELGTRVEALVRAEMRRSKLPGVAVAVAQGGRVLLAKGYGAANVELHVPVSRDTVFQSASVGKQFTAAAVMLEVEDGKLSLDAPVTRYLQDAPARWRDITVRHLLTHTSGIPSYSDADVDQRRDYSDDELLRMAYGLPLEFEPGARWSYSNTGYMLLGILIHRVSGRFYGDVLRERVFAPLGMKTARVISEADIVANRCAGYQLVRGELKNEDWTSPTLMTMADGSLYLSLNDYIAWARGLRANAILTPQSWAAVYTPAALRSGKTYPYGFGWEIDRSKGAPWYYHSGGYGGFTTFISRHLADDLTVVVLSNLASAPVERIVDGITRIVDPALAALERSKPIPDENPEVTARLRRLLQASAAGTLSRTELPAVRRDYFPEDAQWDEEVLRPLGNAERIELVDRRELGDDAHYTYLVTYGTQKVRASIKLAPGDRVADFQVAPE